MLLNTISPSPAFPEAIVPVKVTAAADPVVVNDAVPPEFSSKAILPVTLPEVLNAEISFD